QCVTQLEIYVSSKSQEVEALLAQKYRHGFITDIESDSLPPGLDEGVVAARPGGGAGGAVFDSVSVATTFKEKLGKAGVIFCSFSDAVRDHPELIERYLGSVVPPGDNFFAALNSAVFSDGSFVYVPPGVRCPMELSTYFRINAAKTGQFERTLIIAAEAASVSYLEGCTAPMP